MANHLTPDELSKEVGIDRDEVIRICLEEERADLSRQDRQVPSSQAQLAGAWGASRAALIRE